LYGMMSIMWLVYEALAVTALSATAVWGNM